MALPKATVPPTLAEICRLCSMDLIHLTLVGLQLFLAAALSIELKDVLSNASSIAFFFVIALGTIFTTQLRAFSVDLPF